MMSKQKLFLWLIIVMGIVVGIYHHKLGMKALFVFRQNEPLTSWITIILGPLSTFPAVIISILNKRVGSIWLISGSIISFISFAIEKNFKPNNLVPFSLMIFIPMIVIGILLINAQAKQQNSK